VAPIAGAGSRDDGTATADGQQALHAPGGPVTAATKRAFRPRARSGGQKRRIILGIGPSLIGQG
jgi:hypothetical protein